MIIDYINFVFKDIKARKFSSFLTFFAISLGILSIFVIILVSQGFEQSIEKQFEQLGVNRLIISYDGSQLATLNFNKGLTDVEVNLIENKPYVTDVWPYYLEVAQIKYGNEYVQKQIFGVEMNEQYFTDFNAEIEFGRYPKNNDKFVVVIGPEFAQKSISKRS